LATLKSILRLWLGFSPQHSAVWSAGNGPAMRSAIIGTYFADDLDKRRAFVVASTRLTHTDPRAETAALAVAEAAAWLVNGGKSLQDWLTHLTGLSKDQEWQHICDVLDKALRSNQSVTAFADELGLRQGITGYAYHTVPVALYAWLSHRGDFQKAVEAALDCGGDTDTVGAITGALAGAKSGVNGIPRAWLNDICEWPRSRGLLAQVGERLSRQKLSKQALGPVGYFWPAILVRNGIFLVTVLFHGLRRLLPPY
jgi:ADP-ribosylglycohydrolase